MPKKVKFDEDTNERERENKPSKRKRRIFKSPAKKLKIKDPDISDDENPGAEVGRRLLTRSSYRNSLNSNDIINMSSLEKIKNSARKSLDSMKKK